MDALELAKRRYALLQQEIEALDEMIALGEALRREHASHETGAPDDGTAAVIPLFGRSRDGWGG